MRLSREWVLLPERLAVHLPSETCIVADLHLGYSQARQRCGDAVPLASLEAVLQPLATALTRREVRRLVVAGDLLEDGRVRSGEILAEFRDWLNRHGCSMSWTFIIACSPLGIDCKPLCLSQSQMNRG